MEERIIFRQEKKLLFKQSPIRIRYLVVLTVLLVTMIHHWLSADNSSNPVRQRGRQGPLTKYVKTVRMVLVLETKVENFGG